jgi:hypothetical protein
VVTIMDKESHFHDTVNLIYEAVLDEARPAEPGRYDYNQRSSDGKKTKN